MHALKLNVSAMHICNYCMLYVILYNEGDSANDVLISQFISFYSGIRIKYNILFQLYQCCLQTYQGTFCTLVQNNATLFLRKLDTLFI